MGDKYLFQYCQKIVLFSTDKKSVFLAKRQKEEDYDGVFSFIGGKMETSDVSIIEGFKREKDEEIGKTARVKICPIYSFNVLFQKSNGSSMILPHCLAYFLYGKIQLSSEYSEYQWVKLSNLGSFEPKIENVTKIVEELLRLETSLVASDWVGI